MSNRQNLYLGKSGQFAIMAEFLARGWNTCTPDVDVGDDVLVLEDRKGEFKRVQVKTATATQQKNGYSVQFNIPIKQLSTRITPEIHYAFMIRHDDKWVNTMIIKRKILFDIYESTHINPAEDGNWVLALSFKANKMTYKKVDFSAFIDDFSAFLKISH